LNKSEETAKEIEAIMKKDGKNQTAAEKEKMKEWVALAPKDTRGTLKGAVDMLDLRKQKQKQGMPGEASAAADLGPAGAMELMKKAVAKLSPGGKMTPGALGTEAIAESLGISGEQLDLMMLFDKSMEEQRALQIDKAKKDGASAEELKAIQDSGYQDLWDKMDKDAQEALSQSSKPFAQQQTKLSTDMLTRLGQLVDFLMNEFYNVVTGIWEAVLKIAFGADKQKEAFEVSKKVRASKNEDVQKVWGDSGGDVQKFRHDLAIGDTGKKVASGLEKDDATGKGVRKAVAEGLGTANSNRVAEAAGFAGVDKDKQKKLQENLDKNRLAVIKDANAAAVAAGAVVKNPKDPNQKTSVLSDADTNSAVFKDTLKKGESELFEKSAREAGMSEDEIRRTMQKSLYVVSDAAAISIADSVKEVKIPEAEGPKLSLPGVAGATPLPGVAGVADKGAKNSIEKAVEKGTKKGAEKGTKPVAKALKGLDAASDASQAELQAAVSKLSPGAASDTSQAEIAQMAASKLGLGAGNEQMAAALLAGQTEIANAVAQDKAVKGVDATIVEALAKHFPEVAKQLESQAQSSAGMFSMMDHLAASAPAVPGGLPFNMMDNLEPSTPPDPTSPPEFGELVGAAYTQAGLLGSISDASLKQLDTLVVTSDYALSQYNMAEEILGALEDQYKVLRQQGIKIDKSFMKSVFGKQVEDSTLESTRTALFEYWLYSELDRDDVLKQMEEGKFKTGSEFSKAFAERAQKDQKASKDQLKDLTPSTTGVAAGGSGEASTDSGGSATSSTATGKGGRGSHPRPLSADERAKKETADQAAETKENERRAALGIPVDTSAKAAPPAAKAAPTSPASPAGGQSLASGVTLPPANKSDTPARAAGGLVTGLAGGFAQVQPPAPGEGWTSIGPGERIIPADAPMTSGGGGGGSKKLDMNVKVDVTGAGGADFKQYLNTTINNAIFEYERRKRLT
jgi:hypothetical protein